MRMVLMTMVAKRAAGDHEVERGALVPRRAGPGVSTMRMVLMTMVAKRAAGDHEVERGALVPRRAGAGVSTMRMVPMTMVPKRAGAHEVDWAGDAELGAELGLEARAAFVRLGRLSRRDRLARGRANAGAANAEAANAEGDRGDAESAGRRG